MSLDYIVSRIETFQDNNPYAYVTRPNEFEADEDKASTCPFGPNMTASTSPEDLMKNLSKAMANIAGGGFPTDAPTFKISMREYEDIGIKVGIEIKKSDFS